uniref:C2H2-type domain-containing protein n=1 Tax=Trichogramma kaykai TaxID=54128 RepID=A0ABD2WUU5_9HYME
MYNMPQQHSHGPVCLQQTDLQRFSTQHLYLQLQNGIQVRVFLMSRLLQALSGYSFSTHKKYELSAHITNKHEESHHCKYCGSMVANNRIEHTMYCQNRPKIVCSLCDFYSFQEGKLKDHVQQFHL